MNSTQHPSYELPQHTPSSNTAKKMGTASIVALLVIVLVAVAGIATFWELRSSTENRSRASLGFATVGLNAAQTELKPSMATNAYVTLTPSSKAVSAVDVPLKYDPSFVTISDFTIASDKLPTPLLSTKIDPNAGTLRFVAGISKISGNQQIGLPITQNTQIASFKITAKNKTGNTTISVDGEQLQVAAYDHEDNVGQPGSSIVLSIATQQAACGQTCSTNDECKNDANNLSCSNGTCQLATGGCNEQTACAVTLTRPSNGASMERNDSLAWNACAEAQSFEMILDTGEREYTIDDISTKEYAVPGDITLTPNVTYAWKVRACLNADCTNAGSWSDESTFTVKPPVSSDPKVPKLDLSFLQQGLTREGVTLLVDVTVVYGNDQREQKAVHFTSTDTGALTTAEPIVLDGISLTGGATTEATVYVRTPTSLVGKIGTVTLKGGDVAVLSQGNRENEVIVGDYKRDGKDGNVLKINDISLPINAYTTTSAPVTDETRIYDTNYDDVFDITDISLVLGNFRKLLEYRGDEI